MKQNKKENTKDYSKDILDNPLEGDEKALRKRRRTKKFLIAFSTITSVGLVGEAAAIGIIVTKNKNKKPTPTPVVTHTITIQQPDGEDWKIEVNGKTDKLVVSYGETVNVIVSRLFQSSKRVPEKLFIDTGEQQWSIKLDYVEMTSKWTCSFPMTFNSDIKVNASFIDIGSVIDYNYYTVDQVSNKTWIYDKAPLTTAESPITRYNKDNPEETQTIPRSSFNEPIVVGSKISVIDNSFLTNCKAFNSQIQIKEGVKAIGEKFLIDCVKFNQQIVFPSTLRYILGGFLWMTDDTAENAYSNAGEPLVLNQVTYIGEDFLGNCTHFNAPITITNHVNQICEHFMFNCSSFNQNLTIPEQVTTILGGFMADCNNMTSTLTINCNTTAFPSEADENTCSTHNENALCYKQHIKVSGAHGSDWVNRFSVRTTEPWRYLEYKAS